MKYATWIAGKKKRGQLCSHSALVSIIIQPGIRKKGQVSRGALIYEYDFGDGWEHEVVVEKVLAADSEKKCAVCLDGKNARPPEDCGGIFGCYDLLKAINNQKHAEHQQLLDWLGGPFDPSHFDLQETNTLLRGFKIQHNYSHLDALTLFFVQLLSQPDHDDFSLRASC